MTTITPQEQAQLRALGRLIQHRRKAAKLSRAALAAQLGLSESTLKNLEAGRHRPGQSTFTRLLAVSKLGLRPDDLLLEQPSAGVPVGVVMNTYTSPFADPMKAVADLRERLQGEGGTLEQSALYLDHASAEAWYQVANQPAYAQRRELRHLPDLAGVLIERTGPRGLDIIGLGCGDGHKEARLAQLLCTGCPPPSLRLFLLDVSQPLLGHAFKTASHFAPGVSTFAIGGDFHRLPFFLGSLMERLGSRRRLLCFFGGTFGNLDNEVKFVRHNLQGLEPGDLLLLHVARCFAPADQPTAVLRLDPQLNGATPADLRDLERQWLTGPVERYGRKVGEPLPILEVESRLEPAAAVVPGSYAIEKAVLVRDHDTAKPRRFVMTYVKRYDPDGLSACLEEMGWRPVVVYDHDDLLCLFERI